MSAAASGVIPRCEGADAAQGAAYTVKPMEATRIDALTTVCLKPEDINRIAGSGVLLDVFHRADHAEPRVWIVGGDGWERDGAHPPANARIDGDVLLAVGSEICDRVADD